MKELLAVLVFGSLFMAAFLFVLFLILMGHTLSHSSDHPKGMQIILSGQQVSA